MENVRYNVSPCTNGEITEFIGKIDDKVFIPNGTAKATEKSHYDRYSFLADDSRVAIVYDTTANILSITGRQDHAKQLLDLFDPVDKTIKRSTVPSQGTVPTPQHSGENKPDNRRDGEPQAFGANAGKRAKLFVEPEKLNRRREYTPVATMFASSKGVIISTDEIYPPQTAKRKPQQTQSYGEFNNKFDPRRGGDVVNSNFGQSVQKRPLPSYGESAAIRNGINSNYGARDPMRQTEHGADSDNAVGLSISVGGASRSKSAVPRRAVISFGTEDEKSTGNGALHINTRVQSESSRADNDNIQPIKRKRGRPPKSDKQAMSGAVISESVSTEPQQAPKRRGRPPKITKSNNDVVSAPVVAGGVKPNEQTLDGNATEYKNGYSVKNYKAEALADCLMKLRGNGKKIVAENTEFEGAPQEVKAYTVTDVTTGQKVWLRYATKRMTLQVQGKRSDLFGDVIAQISQNSDYVSALEGYVKNVDGVSGTGKVSDVQNKLKKRLPTAYAYLSEQSRIDFSYGIHDFGQKGLVLSDYSVLLVPAFRGLERFIFDLQAAEGIQVKMIGQAFDKDDSGQYVLKSGYIKRIASVIYPEVLVSLYTEYFRQRNFFAHSDNTGANVSRSIPERATAQRIFDRLLDVVEYNAKKLKEIGFSL